MEQFRNLLSTGRPSHHESEFLRRVGSTETLESLVHGDCVAMNRGADYVQPLVLSPLAPEQGTGPDTAHRSFKLRLPDSAHGAGQHPDSPVKRNR